MTNKRRAVITGIGVIASIGIGKDAFWDALSKDVCGIGDIDLFDTSGYRGKKGAQVRDFDHSLYFDRRELRRMSRCDQFGMVAAEEALKDSGIELYKERRDRIGLVIGSGSGGLLSAEKFRRAVFFDRNARPSLLVGFSSAAFTDYLGFKWRLNGLRTTIATACSSSATAIGHAAEMIKKGWIDVAVTGGSESLAETTFSGFNSLRSVDEEPCRPFDRDRKGISLGEGAAILIVEEYKRAVGRGARIYAEVAGYGITGDAYHVTSPNPKGDGAAYAIELTLKDSGISKSEVGYINAHGTGTPANDQAETEAIKGVFGKDAYNIPVSSTKSMIGHCLGASGALEAVAALMSIVKGIVPPTVNYRNPDPLCDLDYVPNDSRRLLVDVVLSNSMAFGGNNTCIALKAVR